MRVVVEKSDIPDWCFTVYSATMVATFSEAKMFATFCDNIQPPFPLYQIVLLQMNHGT
jgi:hypothetical protein